jgi:hypothetical protein
MDIYEYAESINWDVDYLDPHTGNIFCIQEAGRMKKLFNIEDPEIKVKDPLGNIIGYAQRNKKNNQRAN